MFEISDNVLCVYIVNVNTVLLLVYLFELILKKLCLAPVSFFKSYKFMLLPLIVKSIISLLVILVSLKSYKQSYLNV